jgi:hypothetical protein
LLANRTSVFFGLLNRDYLYGEREDPYPLDALLADAQRPIAAYVQPLGAQLPEKLELRIR